jgi:SPP1 gp7 family putative phage head morphogenesis protein
MATPELLIEISTRHQIFLEGSKTRIANTYTPFLLNISKIIDKKLSGKDLTEFTKSRFDKLRESITADLSDQYKEYYGVWREQIVDLAEYEAGFEARSLAQVAPVEYVIPTRSMLNQAVMNTPLTSIKDIRGTESLQAFYKGWSEGTIEKTTNIIRDGYYIGKTTPQIVREIKGTAGLKFKDGQLARGNRDLSIMTRTAVQHAAVQAREETWKANSDVVSGVMIIATLDSRTSNICINMDHKEFPIDSGPRPPYHPGCRSTVVASFTKTFDFLDKDATRSARGDSGEVSKESASSTYYDFLKKQSPDFQNEVLGKQRATIFRDGGLTSKEFEKLSFDNKGFKTRTLQEMRDLEPLVFERAGLE